MRGVPTGGATETTDRWQNGYWFNGKVMWKAKCNDFITTIGVRAWQTCANGLRRNQAEIRIGGRPTISVVFSMKTGGREHFVQFCGQCIDGDMLRKRKETLARGARML
jgi:hypothetical protein